MTRTDCEDWGEWALASIEPVRSDPWLARWREPVLMCRESLVAGSAVPLRPPEPSLGCDMNVFPGARFAFLIPRSQKLIARTGAIGCLRPFDQFEAIQRLARQREPMLKMRVNYDGGRIGLALRSLFARLNWFEAAT